MTAPDCDPGAPPDAKDSGSMPHVGRNVRHAREAAGLSQSDLAEQLGLNQSSVARMERAATWDTDRLLQVAHALSVNVTDLLHSF
jgi:ribosome-binding protein aMBF1 (putative translation factor)